MAKAKDECAELARLQSKWAMGKATLAEIRRCRNLERRFSGVEIQTPEIPHPDGAQAAGAVVDHGLHSKPVVDHAAANLRDNAAGVGGTDTSRPVTVQEDRFLREAAKRASTLVAPGKLAPGVQSCPLCGANAAAGRHGEGCCVAPGIVIPPVDGARALGSYRLVERGEVIERGDELLADDTLTWLPVAGWTVGTKWDGGVYVPVRRRNAGVVPTQKGQQE